MSGSRPADVPAADESRLLRRVLLATACLITGATSQWALQLTAGRLLQVQDLAGPAFSLGDPAPRSKP
jgi:hypothetical protein